MAKVIRNGIEFDVDEKDLGRPKKEEKVKGDVKLGRKDRLIVKLIAQLSGVSYDAAMVQLNALDNSEPDEARPT